MIDNQNQNQNQNPNQEQHEYETQMYKPMTDDYNTVRLRLDPTPTLDMLRHSLLREFYSEKDEKWLNPRKLRPMLTQEGVEDLMIDLCARMSVDKVLGNIKDMEFNNILREIGESILGFIMFNSEKYEIQEADVERVFYITMHSVRIFLSRARGGVENIHITKQMQYREVKTARDMTQPQQTQAPFGKFFGGGGRQ